jgi:hypothetical protein
MESQAKHEEVLKGHEEKLDEAYRRIGKAVVELRAAEAVVPDLEARRENLDAQIEYIRDLEERVRRENQRRIELERDLEITGLSMRDIEALIPAARQRLSELEGELSAQRAAAHATEKQLHEAKDRYTKLVELNIAELTKCEEARAQNEGLRTSYTTLVQQGKDLLAKCQVSEQANSLLMDRFAAITKQNEILKKDLETAGPQVQIYGNVTLRAGAPEEPYAVLATDGSLLGTGMTQSGGWIAYGPIAGSDPEVDVRIAGTTRRVTTSPWSAATAANPAAPARAAEAATEPARETLPADDLPEIAYPLQTLAASMAR